MTDGKWTPEGEWDPCGMGEVRYLRGQGEGGLEARMPGMNPAAVVRVYPDGLNSGRARNQLVRSALTHASEVNRITRLNADDKAMWLIGFLWAKGLRELEYHIDLGHRAE